jgi:predicted nucleic acid-binding protein
MGAVFIDASALAAVLFDEPQAAPVCASIHGRLLAPGLLRYELASVCRTKTMRSPERARDVEARYALVDSLDLTLVEPHWPSLPRLALRWALSVCDAAYLQLALARRAPIVTLEARLASVHDAATGRG